MPCSQIRSEIRSAVANVRQEQVVMHLVGQGELGRLAIGDEAEVARGGMIEGLVDHHSQKGQKHNQIEADHHRDHVVKRLEADDTVGRLSAVNVLQLAEEVDGLRGREE